MDEIKGISCEVKNCKYHDGSDCCTAGHIQCCDGCSCK